MASFSPTNLEQSKHRASDSNGRTSLGKWGNSVKSSAFKDDFGNLCQSSVRIVLGIGLLTDICLDKQENAQWACFGKLVVGLEVCNY